MRDRWSEALKSGESESIEASRKDTQQRRRPARLRIVWDGGTSLLPYSYLVEVLLSDHQNMTLFFSGVKFVINGQRLDTLLRELQEEKTFMLQAGENENGATINSIARIEPKK